MLVGKPHGRLAVRRGMTNSAQTVSAAVSAATYPLDPVTLLPGIFGDWDCKPYPNEAPKNPPPGRVWRVPLGLRRAFAVEETGPMVADWLHLMVLLRVSAGPVGATGSPAP